MDDPLAGTRVLIAGGDRGAARALGARLATGAAQITVAPDAEAAAQAALAAEYRDDNTREHTERGAALAARLGRRRRLRELAVTRIRHPAPLHDVGKIAIPGSILLEPGRLSV